MDMPTDLRRHFVPATAWRSVRLRRIATWIAVGLAAFALIGFVALPLALRPFLERQLSAALERPVAIGSVAINPFAMSATLRDVSIGGRGSEPALLKLDELYANAELASLFRWAPVIGTLRLTRPAVGIVRNDDKTYSVSDLLDRALSGPPGPPPRFSVSNIEVIDGSIALDDRPEHRQHRVTNLEIGIPFLSSLPSQTEVKVEPKFAALLNGKSVAVTGETRPFKDTHETVLHWDVHGLPLSSYVDYAPVPLPVKIESGTLDASIDFSFVDRGREPSQLTLAGTLRLADLTLREPSNASLLRVGSAEAVVDRIDLIGRDAQVRSMAAQHVELDVRRARDGTVNLSALAPVDTPSAKAATAAPPIRFHVGSLAITDGVVRVADDAVTPAFAATLSDVAVNVKDLSSSDRKAGVAVSFVTDKGARFSHQGSLTLTPLRAEGRLDVAGVHFAFLYPYYASALNLAVDDGTLDGSTVFHYDGAGNALMLSELDATASNVKMRLPDEKEPLWRIPTLAVHGGSVDVAKHAILFESIEGRGASVAVRRNADRTLNFDRLLRAPGSASGTPAEAWQLQASKVAFDDFAATFVDQAVTPNVHVGFSRISLRSDAVSNVGGGKTHATLRATIDKRGTIAVSGPFSTVPPAGTLAVTARDIDLVPLQPYIAEDARILLTGGTASFKGSLDFAAGTPLRGSFKGDVTLADAVVLDEANKADLLKWKSLALGSVDAQLAPLAVTINDIALDGFYARVLLNESGELNLQQLPRERPVAISPPQPTGAPKTVQVDTPPGTATTWLRLGKASLSAGDIDFTDHFIRPNYSARLTGLTGSLSTLAFDQPADLELRGAVAGNAPVQIQGRINPLAKDLFLDIKASATGIDLPPLSPYSGKYVGYGIEKGKLSMKVSYLLDERKLKAENNVRLDQLTFGDKVESADAIKAPVHLAVALLKDRNGVIEFDLPVSGTIDDPQFSVGRLVFRALVGLVVKIVTAPFAVLGALGGHSEEVSYIEFAPGSAVIDPASADKVKAMGKALADRPAIQLDLTGRIDPDADRAALQGDAVRRQVQMQKFNDLVKSGAPPASVSAVEVPADEYDALLLRAYKAADFPKPRNALGIAKDVPREEMESLLLAHATVTDADLQVLATRRAEAVRALLVDGEHVGSERVFLVTAKPEPETRKGTLKPTRVDFALH